MAYSLTIHGWLVLTAEMCCPCNIIYSLEYMVRDHKIPNTDYFCWLQPNFKDYPVYLTKFKQCLSKAMHFMKIHIVNTMQNLTSQLTKRVRSHISYSYTVSSCCMYRDIDYVLSPVSKFDPIYVSTRIRWA